MRLRGGETPWFYLGRFLNNLTIENGRASGVHQKGQILMSPLNAVIIIPFPLPDRTYSQFFTYSQDRSCAPSVFV